MYSCGQRISLGNRIQSRQSALPGRQQSCPHQGERAGYHRSLRAGQAFRGVARELGRASRLLEVKSRSKGDRPNQHPGVCWPARPVDEPTSAKAGRNTKQQASAQGTGREPKANRPGRTKAVVATHSTAGLGGDLSSEAWGTKAQRTHDKAARQRDGNAGHDVCSRERQE
jgi:hypothetical protein